MSCQSGLTVFLSPLTDSVSGLTYGRKALKMFQSLF